MPCVMWQAVPSCHHYHHLEWWHGHLGFLTPHIAPCPLQINLPPLPHLVKGTWHGEENGPIPLHTHTHQGKEGRHPKMIKRRDFYQVVVVRSGCSFICIHVHTLHLFNEAWQQHAVSTFISNLDSALWTGAACCFLWRWVVVGPS